MTPTLRERFTSARIKLYVKLGLMAYGRQPDGTVDGVAIPLGVNNRGTTQVRVYKAATDEWREFGAIASSNPSLLKRIIYRLRVRKINKWLKS